MIRDAKKPQQNRPTLSESSDPMIGFDPLEGEIRPPIREVGRSRTLERYDDEHVEEKIPMLFATQISIFCPRLYATEWSVERFRD